MVDDYKDVDNPNLLEHIPVRIIAYFEECFRQLYETIIDNMEDKTLLKNVKCLKDMKFDFNVIDALSWKRVTLGEYLSYSFPCNSIDNIIDNFSNLFDLNFDNEIFNAFKDINNNVGNSAGLLKIDYEKLKSAIEEIFKKRHIICHEGGLPYAIDKKQYLQMISNAILFFECVNKTCYNIQYPNAPQYQCDMIRMAHESLEAAQDELTKTIKMVSDMTKDDDFQEDFSYMREWKLYRESKAQKAAAPLGDGNMSTLIYLGSKENTTRNMTNELKDKYRKLLLFSNHNHNA